MIQSRVTGKVLTPENRMPTNSNTAGIKGSLSIACTMQ
jgi:hypothetical protein